MDERTLATIAQEHLPPLVGDTPGATEPGAASAAEVDPTLLQVLSTEHWSLLSSRSLVYNEAFARAGMFLTFVSASFVALGFAANAMGVGRDFFVLACGILAVDLLIGLATGGRLLTATVDDLRAIQGMNRIRHGYAEISPKAAPYFVTSIHDDVAGVMASYGGASTSRGFMASFLHGLTTANSMVSIIDAILAAALAGLLSGLAGLASTPAVILGGLAFVVTFLALTAAAIRTIRSFEHGVEARFPTPRV